MRELTLDEVEQVNGGLFALLLIYAFEKTGANERISRWQKATGESY